MNEPGAVMSDRFDGWQKEYLSTVNPVSRAKLLDKLLHDLEQLEPLNALEWSQCAWDLCQKASDREGDLRMAARVGDLYLASGDQAQAIQAYQRGLHAALHTGRLISAGEHQSIEESLRIANEQLRAEILAHEDSIADLNAFAHMVAHDLKSPVGAITGYAYLLSNRLSNSHDIEALRYVEIIEQTGYRMNRIIDELLLLASVRQQVVIPQPIEMGGVVDEVENRLQYIIQENQALVIKPEAWPAAMGYAPWLEEVWANYISNAIKYGGVPPRVELGAEILPIGKVQFWVRDNGDGLTEQAKASLFTPFTRLGKIRATGQGLGLSIVKRIVEKLGGDVGVESAGLPGLGSTFCFTLPVPKSTDR
jgi:signal transduction histidine kinase